jgi:hypothetical protein
LPALKRLQNLVIKFGLDPAIKPGVQFTVDQLHKEGLGMHLLVMDVSHDSTLRLAAEELSK